jgi:HEAT repeat protein
MNDTESRENEPDAGESELVQSSPTRSDESQRGSADTHAAADSGSGSIEHDDVTFARTLLQFFLVPAFVVAVCVGIFLFFAWLVSDERTSLEYLNEVRAGSASRRWQAAFELAKIITLDPNAAEHEGLVPGMVDAFDQAKDDDPRVRHYLALSLGHLKDPSALPSLIDALSDDDDTTRLYSAWALGNIADRGAVRALEERVGDDDAGVRKMAVYALGSIGDSSAVPRVIVALSDPERDVSWNAAIALAQLGDASGEPQLLKMLDREFLFALPEMDDSQRLLTMESAIRAAALLDSEALDARLREISTSEPNVSLRKVALEALTGR